MRCHAAEMASAHGQDAGMFRRRRRPSRSSLWGSIILSWTFELQLHGWPRVVMLPAGTR